MCSYQTLFHSDKTGYVVRCNHCQQIQVAFGTVIINLALEDYASFYDTVLRLKETYPVSDNPYLKKISVTTPFAGLMLYLTEGELSELAVMLENADTELRSDELLKLFHA
ncbi:MAG: hypothetical protein EOO04_10680 [Chitinophagaceae bacterium]|nr:MAG: hypothetical protein EOO04_10680 [Chitinophagaceae bacterium]